MNSKPIFPLLYAGPISYYACFLQLGGRIEKHENFSKQNFRSRCRIYGANGIINLTIPVTKESSKLKVDQVSVSNIDAWQRNHLKSLISAYTTSPFFEYYIHLIQPLYQTKYDSLWEFNLDFHHAILQCLDLFISDEFTSNFEPMEVNDFRLIFASKKPHPKALHFPPYQQVFSYDGPFETDLSILDGIFNLGPALESYLENLPIKN